ncbi:MAG TPA: DnaA N-terminal domain-containing protein [Blastocatellia bacterium]|nr:DnaA N-terminal domain-containing protein [Blastocatellia bacterium]
MPDFAADMIREHENYREKKAQAGRRSAEARKQPKPPPSNDGGSRESRAEEDSASFTDTESSSASANTPEQASTPFNAVHKQNKTKLNNTTQTNKESADRASGAAAPTLTLVPSASSSLSSQVNEIFDHWKTRLRHPNAKLTSERRRLVEARLKKDRYTVEQIKQAIDGCSRSVFHQGGNPQGTVYDDLSLICRDGTHLERFISFTEGAVRTGEAYVGASQSVEPQPEQTIPSPPSETEPDSTVWAEVREAIKGRVNPESFTTWFAPLRGAGYSGTTLLVWVPDRVFREWIENNYRDVLEESLPESITGVRFVTTAETSVEQNQQREAA